MEKSWFMAPMDKALRPQWNIPSYFIDPMEKVWFYEIIVMVKDKKIQCPTKWYNDTMIRYNVNQN